MTLKEERPSACRCLDKNVVVEGLVIVFTVLAGIAITCLNLLEFDIVIIPRNVDISDGNSSQNESYPGDTRDRTETYKEVNEDLQGLLKQVFQFFTIGVSALFFIEIVLKIVTLRKSFFTRPSEVLDGIIVILCAAFQVVYKVVSIPNIYYCVSYLVMARLWRICTVCDIRAKRVKNQLEKDIEHRITDHLETRQRCFILENISMQQELQIKELHAQRMKFSEYHDKRDVSGKSQLISEKELSSEDIQNNNIELSNGGNRGKRKSRSSSRQSSKGFNESFKIGPSANEGNDVSGLYSKVNPRPRWRRSSTTEYLERRMTLHSDQDDFSQTFLPKPASMSNLLSHESSRDADSLSPTVDYTSDYMDEVDGKRDDVSLKTLSGSETSSNQEMNKKKCQFKRQNSCPECMFTQRMKITKYESMLIEDHRLSDIYAYDNNGFFPEDGIQMSVLAANNDTGTYRSQDGIPTTDL